MAENIDKKITITLQGRDDGATAAMSKVEAKAIELERTLKKVGKITGVGAFRTGSDIAEGFTGELGNIGRIAAIAAAAEAAGRLMKTVGDGLQNAIDKGESFTKVLDDIGNKIPVVGTLKQGFESLAVGIAKSAAAVAGMDTDTAGRRAGIGAKFLTNPLGGIEGTIGELTGANDAKADGDALDKGTKDIRARIEANKKDEDALNAIIRSGMNDRQKLEAERDDKLEELMERRRQMSARNGGLTQDQEAALAAAEATVRKESADKIAKSIADGAAKVAAAEKHRIDSIREIQADSLDRLRDTSEVERAIIDANGEAEEAKLREAGKDLEARISEIKRKADDALNDIDIRSREVAGDASLTPDQRNDLGRKLNEQAGAVTKQRDAEVALAQSEARRNAEEKLKQAEEQLASELERQADERQKIGQTSLENQRAPRSSITDARGQLGFLAQSREFVSPQVEATKATDKNTKATEDLTKTIADLRTIIGNLNPAGAGGNAGFIG